MPLNVEIDAPYSRFNGTTITHSNINAFNFHDNKTEVIPKPIDFSNGSGRGNYSLGNGSFFWKVPSYSITVLQFDL